MEREREQLIRMNARAWRRITVKGLGQDRSLIRRKSVGDVSCLSSPNDLISSLGRCPRSHLPLIGCCLASSRLASSLDPRPDPSALLCPLSGPHLHPRGSPSLPGCTRCLSSIPVPHRSWSISGSIPLSRTTPPLGSTTITALHSYGSYSCSCNLMPHPLPDLL